MNYLLRQPVHYYSSVQEPILIPVEAFDPVLVGDKGQAFNVTLGTLTGYGTLTESGLIVYFVEPVSIPANFCLALEPIADKAIESLCQTTLLTELTDNTRLAVLDCNQCPTQYITLGMLKKYLGLAIPSVCDQLPTAPVNLSADVQLVGVLQSTCQLVRVNPQSLACEKVPPAIPCPMMTR